MCKIVLKLSEFCDKINTKERHNGQITKKINKYLVKKKEVGEENG